LSNDERSTHIAAKLILVTLVLMGLFISSLHSYLLFHSLVELFSVIVAFVIFIIAWNTRHVQDNQYVLFVGIASLFSGTFALLHALAYKGMGILPGNDANLPTQLWIAYRYLFSVSLVVASYFVKKKVPVTITVSIFSLASFILGAAIFLGRFPVCFIEGSGLTDFKIISEYVIICLLLAAFVRLYRQRAAFDSWVWSLMSIALAASAVAELAFTKYASIFGMANLAGHLFIFISYACIYEAIVVTGMAEPTRLLFRKMKAAQEDLHISEERLRLMNDNLPDNVLYQYAHDPGGKVRFMHIGSGIENLNGVAVEDVLRDAGTLHRQILPEYFEQLVEAEARSARELSDFAMEVPMRRTDGQIRWMSLKSRPRRMPDGRIIWDGVQTDITDRKLAETERSMRVEFLDIVNKTTSTADLIREATAFFHRRSGCEAVGIRMREGYDYPYFETIGFPPEFVEAETRLCSSDKDGNPLCDGAGNPILDCMCGNIICGRFDPSKPFFTARGNFWTNSTSELLASTTEADRRTRTRNRCNGEGYESVALLGLSHGKERIGLLQLNDRHAGRFTPQLVSLWERLADYLAVALAKLRSDEMLGEREKILRLFIEHAPAALAMFDRDMRYISASRRWVNDFRLGNRDMRGLLHYDIFPEIPEYWKEIHRRALAGDVIRREHDRFERTDGSVQWLTWEVRPWFGETDKLAAGLVIFCEDITDLKQSEEALRASNEELTRFNRSVVDRELRMIELKAEINELCAGACLPPRYKVDFEISKPTAPSKERIRRD